MTAYAEQWAEINRTAYLRPPSWCCGCGYFRPTLGCHRRDCTNPAVVRERRRAVIRERLAAIDRWRSEQPNEGKTQ